MARPLGPTPSDVPYRRGPARFRSTRSYASGVTTKASGLPLTLGHSPWRPNFCAIIVSCVLRRELCGGYDVPPLFANELIVVLPSDGSFWVNKADTHRHVLTLQSRGDILKTLAHINRDSQFA